MAIERVILCGDVSDAGLGRGPEPVRLRTREPGRNVFLTIRDMLRGIYTEVPAAFLDLLDVATYVYAADQAVPRTGCGDFEGNWRRDLRFRVAVREPDVWRSPDVHDALVSVLSFLSEDQYRFEFEPAADAAPLGEYVLDFNATAFDGMVEEVALFSGGLDSFGGAVREAVVDGRKVLLVNHRSNPEPGPRYRRLAEGLARHAGTAAPFHLPVRINKTSRLSRESTQRARSFLYAAAAATMARMIGLPRVRFYENGVTSLNLPLGRQEVGARATRTTHPRTLAGFARLFTALAGRPLGVENPFCGLTKTDVVQSIANAGCADLIADTKSCVETRWRTGGAPHCGDCSQCIDRRFAVLAAGLADHDPESGYAIDLLTGARPDGGSRTLLAAYVDTATRVAELTPEAFLGRFGEAARALPYLPGGAAAAAREVHRLYTRHAGQVTRVVDDAVSAAASGGLVRRGTLPPTCLIRLLVGDAGEPPPPDDQPADDPAPNVFQLRGQAYVVRFGGGEDKILLPGKGPAYVHALLSRPWVAISAATLVSRVALRRDEFRLGDAGPRTDDEALAAYRERIVELEEAVAAARANNDAATQEAAEREIAQLRAELKRSRTLRGKLRDAKSDREGVRKAVTVAIGRVIEAVAKFNAPMADHLKVYIDRGSSLVYQQPSGVRWLT